MKKYFVFSGYVSPDNYDNSEGPTYGITECNTKEEVLKLREEFDKGMNDECSYITFRVFYGDELLFIPKTRVVEFDLV